MSGEAYELPDTRMDIHEPALDVIEECLVPLDANNEDSDAANIFVLPGMSNAVLEHNKHTRDNGSISSSSTETDNGDAGTFRNVPIETSVSVSNEPGALNAR